MRKITILLLLVVSRLAAEGIVNYNSGTGGVTGFRYGDPSLATGTFIVLDENNLTVVSDLIGRSIAIKYWLVEADTVKEMSQAQKDSVDLVLAAADTLSIRTGAKALFEGFEDIALYERAKLEVLRREINLLREWTRDFKTETAAATSLANFQTRVAGLPTLGDRTLAQFKSAVLTEIDAKTVDVAMTPVFPPPVAKNPVSGPSCGSVLYLPLLYGLWLWIKRQIQNRRFS